MPLLGNDELARIFYEIGDMLEIQGEMPFKIGAYRRAAESIAHSPAGRGARLPRRDAAEELEAFEAAGARVVRLGDEVLRTSTAGVAAVAALLAQTPRWA